MSSRFIPWMKAVNFCTGWQEIFEHRSYENVAVALLSADWLGLQTKYQWFTGPSASYRQDWVIFTDLNHPGSWHSPGLTWSWHFFLPVLPIYPFLRIGRKSPWASFQLSEYYWMALVYIWPFCWQKSQCKYATYHQVQTWNWSIVPAQHCKDQRVTGSAHAGLQGPGVMCLPDTKATFSFSIGRTSAAFKPSFRNEPAKEMKTGKPH